ncbi:Alpha/Beta hydrolase [Parasponia andersonii]|uniref:Alpha/Beta hydrolase n=1 Tax=Parasponia andersonii TaxID=3476 RepID=A0A2P5C7P1_PARAD|nr:Alpha/Beta hydrolase [Parasponia andersonii]
MLRTGCFLKQICHRLHSLDENGNGVKKVPVRHLVFMVHGIGQRLEKSNLVDDVGNFRQIAASLAEQHLTSHQRGTQRVLYIPCQWRKGLKLSGESAVEKITLDGVRGLRVMLSATVHDVLYYMSPIYCQDIINSVSNQLNRLYLKFLKRNPGYNGKVSIYGHSLGSVLSYDILCHQENLKSPFPMDWLYKEHAKDEKSSTVMNNQSGIDEIDGMLGPIDDDKRSSEQAFLMPEEDASEGNIEDSSTVMSPAMSDSDEFTRFINSKQPSDKEDVHEAVDNSSDKVPCKSDILDETTRINSGVTSDDLGTAGEEVCKDTSDKDKIIELLQKEIDSLKVKIAELESGGEYRSLGLHQENKEVLETSIKDPVLEKLPAEQDDVAKSYTPCIRYTKLEFKVDTFFAVGSPLGVFLALRNIRIGIGKGQEYWAEENINEEMPACRQMLNIFHPFDPVAYRIEPLVCKEYISKRPVIIPYHKGGKRLYIGFQEFSEHLAAQSQAIMDHLYYIRVKVLTVCQSRNADSREEDTETAQEKEKPTYGSLMMERLTGSVEGRIDYVLQDETFRHPYLSAIGSHTNYWRDCDTALFILKHLYRDIPEDPNSPKQSIGGNLKNDGGSSGWIDRREAVEEEIPLTFSDRSAVRNFSSKAKKFLKKR